MTTEILNLEELLPERPRIVQLKQVDYMVPEPSLAQDLQVRAVIKKFEDRKSDISEEETMFTVMAEIVKIRVPDMPHDQIETMSLPRLSMLFRFIQGSTIDELKTELAKVESEVQQAMETASAAEGAASKN